MTKQIKLKPEKPLTKKDIDREIKRIEYLLENYTCFEYEQKNFTANYLEQLYRERDKLASKKEAKEANL